MAEDFQQAKDDIAFIKGFLGSAGRAPAGPWRWKLRC